MEQPKYFYQFKDGTRKENLSIEEAMEYQRSENYEKFILRREPKNLTITFPPAFTDFLLNYDETLNLMNGAFSRGYFTGVGTVAVIAAVIWLFSHFNI